MADRTIHRLSGPPRLVSPLAAAQMFFGRFSAVFGWLVLGFGMFFFWGFGLNTDPAALSDFKGPLETARGTLTSVEDTGASEGGSDGEDGTPILAYAYQFDFQGRRYEGVSFLTEGGPGSRIKVGSPVDVEFPPGRPDRSRVRGMRTAVFEPWLLVIGLMFPLTALGFIIMSLNRGWKEYGILRHGISTEGKLVEKIRTNTSVNRSPVYKMTYEFDGYFGGPGLLIVRTHRTETLSDGRPEPLLFDPARPNRAILLALLPGAYSIDNNGGIVATHPVPAFLSLVPPLLTSLGHGAYGLMQFSGLFP